MTSPFEEDPFKNANHRYGDPFELAGADLFSGQEDPFTAPVSAAFGASGSGKDSFNSAFPSSTSSTADPFSLTLSSSLQQKETNPNANDPFSPFKNAPSKSSTANPDPFGSDPFGAPATMTTGKSADDSWADFGTQQPKTSPTRKASKSLATSWGDGNDPFGSRSFNKEKRPNTNNVLNNDKKSVVSRVSNADPFKLSLAKPNNTSKPSKEKKKHKWVPKLKSDSSKSKATPTAPPAVDGKQMDAANLKMAAEASRRAEQERQRRLQLQEEQDLAYAIALSKAEAASTKAA